MTIVYNTILNNCYCTLVLVRVLNPSNKDHILLTTGMPLSLDKPPLQNHSMDSDKTGVNLSHSLLNFWNINLHILVLPSKNVDTRMLRIYHTFNEICICRVY